MAKEAIGQIICECGHVAEIRRRANGKKLPFKVCKHCGVQQGKELLRNMWLEKLGDYGVFGEKPNTQLPKSAPEPEKLIPTNKCKSSEWTPPEELKPEVCEPADDPVTPEKTGDGLKPKRSNGWLLKVALGVATAGLAIWGINIKQTQQQ